MAKISLRAYDREIEGLIEHGQRIDEALAHCRQILKAYPKHLETYRLLGKAYLEAKRYDEAVDIFHRVLVAAPEDFVSHVGMSIIADDHGRLDEAIWHMERAFEMQPSNAAIQGELQRLFGRRDGVEPPKIRLTRGALARMYVQGELYSQAVSEIKAVLANDGRRTDMQALLARAYFSSGQKTEAAAICTELLSRFPYCLDANRLMAEIMPGTQRADSAVEYRQRVNELDPYAAFAQESLFHTESVADAAVSLDRLDYSGAMPEAGATTLGIGLEPSRALTAPGTGEPTWATDAAADRAAAAYPSSSTEDIPGFMRQAGWTESSASTEELSSTLPEESESAPTALPGDLPAWVRALAPAEDSGSTAEPSASAVQPEWLRSAGVIESAAVPPESPEADDLRTPDWLKDLGGGELDRSAIGSSAARISPLPGTGAERPEVPAPQDESPSWLKDFEGDLETPIQKGPSTKAAEPPQVHEPSGNIGALGTSPQEQDDAMAWLEGLAAKHGAKPEELVTDVDSRTEVAPDWIDRAKEIGEPGSDTLGALEETAGAPPPISEVDATGMWLKNLDASEYGGQEPLEGAKGDSATQPFDWMSGLSDQSNFGGIEAGQENEDASLIDAGDAPDWLRDLGQKPAPAPASEEAPAWLNTQSTETGPPESQVQAEPLDRSESEVSLPEWLAGLDQEQTGPAPAAASQGDVPPWLRADAEPEPNSTERTQPADWLPAESAGWSEPEVSRANMGTKAPVSSGAGSSPRGDPEAMLESEPRGRVSMSVRPSSAAVVPRPGAAIPASLQVAQSELGRGNIAASLDVYARLIRKGRSLEEIIRDLRDALYRYPVEVPIWQALGDAYMRANRLQEALDAYTKAEELLR